LIKVSGCTNLLRIFKPVEITIKGDKGRKEKNRGWTSSGSETRTLAQTASK
jgi:hypothetical protein